jgi:hypothetical protein
MPTKLATFFALRLTCKLLFIVCLVYVWAGSRESRHYAFSTSTQEPWLGARFTEDLREVATNSGSRNIIQFPSLSLGWAGYLIFTFIKAT